MKIKWRGFKKLNFKQPRIIKTNLNTNTHPPTHLPPIQAQKYLRFSMTDSKWLFEII